MQDCPANAEQAMLPYKPLIFCSKLPKNGVFRAKNRGFLGPYVYLFDNREAQDCFR
jgi:type IV secretory pathway protease TraF